MGIIFKKTKAKQQQQPVKTDAAFEKWYEQHKENFNSGRRRRYHSDPEYRARVLATSQRSRANRKKVGAAVKPDAYRYNLAQAASLLGITVWTMRNWRQNGYFPEPLRFGGEVWFTDRQVAYLTHIRSFFLRKNIRRISAAQKEELNQIVQVVHANWG